MCGIVGYIGKKNAVQAALHGLKRLEYRGYDSAGIAAIAADGNFFLRKSVGKIASLEKKLVRFPLAQLAIGHTRWATHGSPTAANAHPHADCKNEIFIAHNGIIENYEQMREALIREGHVFVSETDSEVLAHLIERYMSSGSVSFQQAVANSLSHVRGTFGLAALSKKEPGILIGARRGSPLLVGLNKNEHVLASDPSAIAGHTRRVIYLDDNEMVVLTPDSQKIYNISKPFVRNAKTLKKPVKIIDWPIEDSQKGGFKHFMLKEIFEAPQVIENALRGRAIARTGEVKLGGLDSCRQDLAKMRRAVIVACGTSYYAGLIGKYLFETFAGIPAETAYGSEFRYHSPTIDEHTLVLAISQSGETADTLEAIRQANRSGAFTIGITNVVGSSVAREVRAGIYNYAGPEIAVASTKAFVSQLAVLTLVSVYFGRLFNCLDFGRSAEILRELLSLPFRVKSVIREQNEKIKRIANAYRDCGNFFFLGRKYSWPVALEGALKLKEISYLHAEGYPFGEMKHGPIALIDKSFPSVVIALKDSVYEKTVSNIHEIKARGGKIIAIASAGDEFIRKSANHAIAIPKIREELSPILSVIPLHLFAYHMAALKGCDIDKPRNLAKSVTVE